VTLKAVAQAAGVHVSTASRAINPRTRHLVADELAERILAAAQDLGYRPDPLAAGLRTGRSHLVGIVVPDIANPVFAPILAGLQRALAEAGFAVLVANAPSAAEAAAVVDGLAAQRVEGMVLATAGRRDLAVDRCVETGIPTVLVNRGEDRNRLPTVVSDDRAGMRLAVDHLVALGHRAIGHVAGPADVSTGHLRRRGFEEAMRDVDLDPRAVTVADGYTRAAGRAAAAALLAAHPGLTAIAAANDLLALGAYEALREVGLECPRDVSVVGHNDMPLVDLVSPALTTVRIGHAELGREAAQILVRRMERPDAPVGSVVLTPELVVRGSTASPARATVRAARRAAG
jgi:LacI family transcriptional regulator